MVIHISPEREVLLGFLFPCHSILDTSERSRWSGRFIVHYDVCSRSELDSLAVYYPDGIFLSNRLWDATFAYGKVTDERLSCDLTDAVLTVMTKRFACLLGRNSRCKFEPSEKTFVDDCVDFIFCFGDDVEFDLNALYKSFGSARFRNEFSLLVQKGYSVPLLEDRVLSYILRILTAGDSSDPNLRQKYALFHKKIKANFPAAAIAYKSRGMHPSSSGISGKLRSRTVAGANKNVSMLDVFLQGYGAVDVLELSTALPKTVYGRVTSSVLADKSVSSGFRMGTLYFQNYQSGVFDDVSVDEFGLSFIQFVVDLWK